MSHNWRNINLIYNQLDARFRCVSKRGDWPPNYGHFHAENDYQFQLFSSSIYWALYFQTNPNEVVEILIEGRYKHGVSIGILTHNSIASKWYQSGEWTGSYQIDHTNIYQAWYSLMIFIRGSARCSVCGCLGCPCPIMWCCWRLLSSDS